MEILGLLFFIFFMSILGLLIPIIALIDIIRSEFIGNNKIAWVLIVIFFPIIGAIIYFVIGNEQKIKNTGSAN